MNVEEIRVGNYGICHTGNPAQISLIDFAFESDTGNDFDKWTPIKLTEEWLFRFGFMPKEYGYVNQIYVRKPDNRVNGFYFEFDGFDIGKEVVLKYVHQLQNLYHALTGQELTIKK